MIFHMLCWLAGILAVLFLTILVVWFGSPHVIIKSAMCFQYWKLGYKFKYLRLQHCTYCYVERGIQTHDKPSLLLVHGFSASKDSWLSTTQKFPKDLHVVVIDLMGHGDSTIPGVNYVPSLERMTKDIHNFVTAIGLSDFHLIGTSMGGAIAQNYAAHYPDELKLLTLICPAMRTPVETEFQREITTGHCALIPATVDEFDAMLRRVCYTKLNLSRTILRGLLHLRLPKNEFYQRVFIEIHKLDSGEEGRAFEKKAELIHTPTQIIWGQQDELLHVSGAELLRSRLSGNVRMDIIDDCGHSVGIDRPGALTKHLLAFREQFKKDNSLNGYIH